MNDCRRFREDLDAYADGMLDGPEKPPWKRICKSCPDCAETLREIRRLQEALSGMEEAPSEALHGRILEAVRGEQTHGEHHAAGTRRPGPARWVGVTAASLAALLLIGGGIYTWMQSHASSSATTGGSNAFNNIGEAGVETSAACMTVPVTQWDAPSLRTLLDASLTEDPALTPSDFADYNSYALTVTIRAGAADESLLPAESALDGTSRAYENPDAETLRAILQAVSGGSYRIAENAGGFGTLVVLELP